MLRHRTSGLLGSVCEKRRVRDVSLEITEVDVEYRSTAFGVCVVLAQLNLVMLCYE